MTNDSERLDEIAHNAQRESEAGARALGWLFILGVSMLAVVGAVVAAMCR